MVIEMRPKVANLWVHGYRWLEARVWQTRRWEVDGHGKRGADGRRCWSGLGWVCNWGRSLTRVTKTEETVFHAGITGIKIHVTYYEV